MELSNRSPAFRGINSQSEKDLKQLLGVPKDEFELFFFPGSASLQFSAIPYNLLGGANTGKKAHYLTTGHWSECARREAAKLCSVIEVWPEDYL
jgi:phosphoserine aminotransferase